MNTDIGLFDSWRLKIKHLEHRYQQYRLTSNETVIADTEYGKVKGIKRMSIYDDPFYSFEKIPFAQPPIGELRFKAPQRPTPWTDIRDCTHFGSKAVQLNFLSNKVEGSEDCLYLNVYTNNLNPEKPRPVMVWIHGGGFIIGEANRDWYGPDYFMKKDIVLICIQYRLGAFGFLSVKDPNLNTPGNAGLKDQVLALKWVKNNCAHFGGNPDCITVFGESAGAASTHYLMLNDQVQGLFHRAILMSGCAMSSWALTDSSSRILTFAKAVGYTGSEDNEKEILDFLLNAKAKDLITAEGKILTLEERQKRILFPFGPTIEPYSSADCAITKHPREMMRNAWSNSIPILIGCTSYEGLFWLPEIKKIPQLIKDMETCVAFLPHEISQDPKQEEYLTEKGMKLKKAHVTDLDNPATPDNYMDLLSFMHFLHPVYRTLRSRIQSAVGAPIFLYRFDFDSDDLINPYRIMRCGRGVRGVSHTDELSYLFSSFIGRKMSKDTRELRTIERMIGLWTTFAEMGKPNGSETLDETAASTWEPLMQNDDEKPFVCLNISDEMSVIEYPEMEKIKAWNSIFDNCPELLY